MPTTTMLLMVLGSLPGLALMIWILKRNAALLKPGPDPKLSGFAQARRVSIADLPAHPEEVVHLVGVVRGAAAARGPVTGRPCAAYQVRVEANWGRWRSELHVESVVGDFELHDDTGTVRVQGKGASAVLVTGTTRVEGVPADLEERALEKIPAGGVRPVEMVGIESVCVPGDRVAVLARVPAEGARAPFRSAEGMVLKTKKTLESVITNEGAFLTDADAGRKAS